MFRLMKVRLNEQQLYIKLQKAIEEAPRIPACQTTDPEIWFGAADREEAEQRGFYRMAKELCAKCPVNNLCLEYAMVAGEEYGVWGGLSPDERKRMRRATRNLTQSPLHSQSPRMIHQ
jgi:WhiB family redox-sensing transcriptional regulator